MLAIPGDGISATKSQNHLAGHQWDKYIEENKYIKIKCRNREIMSIICVNPCVQLHQHKNLLINGENKNPTSWNVVA